jgi:hypothetical protein
VYQGLDVAAHYPEADLWLVANPEKQRKNHFAFMRNWLARAKRDATDGVRSNSKQPASLYAGQPPPTNGVRAKPEAIERARQRELVAHGKGYTQNLKRSANRKADDIGVVDELYDGRVTGKRAGTF